MKLPDAELEVLKGLWELGPASIRDLASRCYSGDDPSAHSTVQKLLQRLMAKGCVARQRQGRRHIYRAVAERSDLIEQRLRETADKLCEGSMTPLITQLIDSSHLTREELARLRNLIDELEDQSREEVARP